MFICSTTFPSLYRSIKLREFELLEARGTCLASRVIAATGDLTVGGCVRGRDMCSVLTAITGKDGQGSRNYHYQSLITGTSDQGGQDMASGQIIRHRLIIIIIHLIYP